MPRVLFVGDLQHREFRATRRSLSEPGVQLRLVEDVAAAVTLLGEDAPPEMIVVGQTWPDQYCAADAGRLIERFPLARLVVACGAWCESDGRNRDVWPPAVRVPAPGAAGRLRREAAVLAGQRPPLPVTAARDEAWRFDYPSSSAAGDPLHGVLVAIRSPDGELSRYLTAVVRDAGADVVSNEICDVLLVDVDPESHATLDSLRSSREPGPQIVAIAGFAHPDCLNRQISAGAAAVLDKLAPGGLLVETIQQLSRKREP